MDQRRNRINYSDQKSNFIPARSPILQRKCACGNSTGLTATCGECQKKELTLQHRSSNQGKSVVPPIVHEALNMPGQALDSNSRESMESYFGYDFSQVRVHADQQAAASAQAVNALAYTVGQRIVFGAGQYSPNTRSGKQLLAHELTHVVQQNQGIARSIQRQPIDAPDSETDDALEQQAEHTAKQVVAQAPKKTAQKGKSKKQVKSSQLTLDQVKSHINSNNKSDQIKGGATLSTEVLLCLIWKESGFNPNEKNASSSATGLMQMTKGAVAEVNKNTPKGVHFSHSEMTDPAKNIACGTYYLSIRIKWAGGDIQKGMEGYGTGAGYADNILKCETCLQGNPSDPNTCLTAIHA